MSKTYTFNNSLSLTIPDSFRKLEEAEREKMNMLADGPGMCFQDPDRHIMISIGWQTLNMVTSLLFSVGDAADNMKSAVSKGMQPYGYYALDNFQNSIAGNTAEGMSYEYKAQDIRMYGESCVAKHAKTLYYFHFYARKELKDMSINVWKGILSSAKWL